MSVEFLRTQNPIGPGGGGFLSDPFLDLNGGVTTAKTTKIDSTCLSNGALAGAIIATFILSAFIGFLTWFTYLRPKFQELQYQLLNAQRRIPNSPANRRSFIRRPEIIDDSNLGQLPLDAIDYKFGTFPFRQSQISTNNGHFTRPDWLNRIPSSFRSVNIDRDSELIDIELLEPTFSGLNFSITGNMRAGIFVKEILNKGQAKSNRLKTGDRIMALTVCFESIVYEDALTILSYASPYPVILRIKRPSSPVKIHITTEKRSIPINLSNKVKWREDFEHYDNESSRSYIQPNRPPLPPITTAHPIPTPKIPSSPKTTKKINPQSRPTNRSSTITTTKGNRMKTSSASVMASSGATSKRMTNDVKRYRTKENVPRSNPPILTSTMPATKLSMKIPPSPMASNKKPVKSVADAVMSYLHYKGAGGEPSTDAPHPSEATMMPYYDSPYDYYYGGQASQYQYLHQSQLNRNNNNSRSAETLTAVTPNLAASVYTLHLSSVKSVRPFHRRCERRLSSPAIITTVSINEKSIDDLQARDTSMENLDTFV